MYSETPVSDILRQASWLAVDEIIYSRESGIITSGTYGVIQLKKVLTSILSTTNGPLPSLVEFAVEFSALIPSTAKVTALDFFGGRRQYKATKENIGVLAEFDKETMTISLMAQVSE